MLFGVESPDADDGVGERSGGAGAAPRPLDEPATDVDASTRDEDAGSDNKLPFFFLE